MTTASCTSPTAPSPRSSARCAVRSKAAVFTLHAQERAADATPEQSNGPGWLLTEFGATTDTADLARITADANANLVGWIYWQWINYADPTGSHSSALWPPRQATPSQLRVLSETYPSAVAGTPLSMAFDPTTAQFILRYLPDHTITAPTVIVVPVAAHYPHGYCPQVTGGRVASKPGASRLDIENTATSAAVTVSVTAGTC